MPVARKAWLPISVSMPASARPPADEDHTPKPHVGLQQELPFSSPERPRAVRKSGPFRSWWAMPWRLCTPPEGHFDALKGIYVRKHTDLTWSSGADLRLQYGASSDRMRHRNALVSIARQRHLDRRSSCCPDGHARYTYWVDICVLIAASRDIAFTVNHAL